MVPLVTLLLSHLEHTVLSLGDRRALCIFVGRLLGDVVDFVNLWQLLFILYEIASGLHRFNQVAKLGKFKAAFFFVKIEADLCNVRIDTIAFFLEILKLSAIKIYFDKAKGATYRSAMSLWFILS